ncbi:YkuS family protein [Aciduricibacillus chroicocephali]|uniref:YkuS family protein n=1 Tax=Aciduricibacillus chroicocephali TaxID=3054939 RepID=A0ABY9KW80_9BACI|nr:YkuS family protein [Bacillaceae bacterium 44XB]
MAKIAVEEPFDDIQKALEEKGHEVKMFIDNNEIKNVDLGVVRHMNEFDEGDSEVPFVIAHGKSVDDVVNEVEQRLSRFN